MVVFYTNDGVSDYGTYRVGVISGTSITFETAVNHYTNFTSYTAAVYDPDQQKSVVFYRQNSDNNGRATVLQVGYSGVTNLTASNFIGFSQSSYTNGQIADINISGSVDENQTALTAGQIFYVQADGTLSTTADNPSVTAGTAVASTKIIVKG